VTKKKRLITLTPGHSQGCHQLQEDRWRTHQVIAEMLDKEKVDTIVRTNTSTTSF
jgi:hypothetical protein